MLTVVLRKRTSVEASASSEDEDTESGELGAEHDHCLSGYRERPATRSVFALVLALQQRR